MLKKAWRGLRTDDREVSLSRLSFSPFLCPISVIAAATEKLQADSEGRSKQGSDRLIRGEEQGASRDWPPEKGAARRASERLGRWQVSRPVHEGRDATAADQIRTGESKQRAQIMIMLFSALAEKRLKLWPKQGERNRMMLEGGRWFALPQTTRSRRPRRMPRARAGNCLDGDNEKRKSKRERKSERERRRRWRRERAPPQN